LMRRSVRKVLAGSSRKNGRMVVYSSEVRRPRAWKRMGSMLESPSSCPAVLPGGAMRPEMRYHSFPPLGSFLIVPVMIRLSWAASSTCGMLIWVTWPRCESLRAYRVKIAARIPNQIMRTFGWKRSGFGPPPEAFFGEFSLAIGMGRKPRPFANFAKGDGKSNAEPKRAPGRPGRALPAEDRAPTRSPAQASPRREAVAGRGDRYDGP